MNRRAELSAPSAKGRFVIKSVTVILFCLTFGALVGAAVFVYSHINTPDDGRILVVPFEFPPDDPTEEAPADSAVEPAATEPANEPSARLDKRVPWTTSRVTGSPEPPPKYRTERVWPKIKFEHITVITYAPGSDRLFVTEQAGKMF